jgi:hypothetical protein
MKKKEKEKERRNAKKKKRDKMRGGKQPTHIQNSSSLSIKLAAINTT